MHTAILLAVGVFYNAACPHGKGASCLVNAHVSPWDDGSRRSRRRFPISVPMPLSVPVYVVNTLGTSDGDTKTMKQRYLPSSFSTHLDKKMRLADRAVIG